MSDRKQTSRTEGHVIEWTLRSPEPTCERPNPASRTGDILVIAFGILLPAAVLAIEGSLRLCSQAFFDPIPTWGHMVLIGLVPATNLMAYLSLRQNALQPPVWLGPMLGAALAISGFYALLFLPLAPIAVVAILYFGLGLLPFGPMAGFLSSLALLHRLRTRRPPDALSRRRVWIGAAIGLTALVAHDVPSVVTRTGLQWALSDDTPSRERGLRLLRTFGSQEEMLRLAYDVGGRSGGPLSLLFGLTAPALWDEPTRDGMQSPEAVREVFYRTYGVAFNALPPPQSGRRWARFEDVAFDADHGGAAVGGRIRGLELASSRIDGSLNGDDATGYLEWTFEFRNTSPLDREARLTLALPPGAVVSRATLWVNGEEREAAYAGRAQVRQAYEQVAVRQRRDPLLVTTKGADRVLAQAFPVPRNGTLKMKIGLTTPLSLDTEERGSLALPAIVDRNFGMAGDFRHAVWMESRGAVASSSADFSAAVLPSGVHRIEGHLSDADLTRTRPELIVMRDPARRSSLARIEGAPDIHQRIVAADPHRRTLLLVVDGSQGMTTHADAIAASLPFIPSQTRVGLIIAGEPMRNIAPAALTPQHAARIRLALRSQRYVGGQDNTLALAEALKAASLESHARILWIHGPQPLRFTRSAADLEQAASRLSAWPQIDHYAVAAGPNELWPDEPWAWQAHLLPAHGDVGADLKRYVSSPPAWTITREPASSEAGVHEPSGSAHIVRLWARDEVLRMMAKHGEERRAESIALAGTLRLVTPVSGAVVLETAQQFEANNLTPAAAGTIPTVPEPHEWALMILAAISLIFLLKQQRLVDRGPA